MKPGFGYLHTVTSPVRIAAYISSAGYVTPPAISLRTLVAPELTYPLNNTTVRVGGIENKAQSATEDGYWAIIPGGNAYYRYNPYLIWADTNNELTRLYFRWSYYGAPPYRFQVQFSVDEAFDETVGYHDNTIGELRVKAINKTFAGTINYAPVYDFLKDLQAANTTDLVLAGLFNPNYYWRVRAVGFYEETGALYYGEWSETRTLKIEKIPDNIAEISKDFINAQPYIDSLTTSFSYLTRGTGGSVVSQNVYVVARDPSWDNANTNNYDSILEYHVRCTEGPSKELMVVNDSGLAYKKYVADTDEKKLGRITIPIPTETANITKGTYRVEFRCVDSGTAFSDWKEIYITVNTLRIHSTYIDNSGSAWQVYSDDYGESWSEPVEIAPPS